MGFTARVRAFMRFVTQAARLARRVHGADLVFATSPPLTVSLPGALAARCHNAPLVFEVRDLWPEFARAMGLIRNPLIYYAARVLEAWSYQRASRIIALAPGVKRAIAAQGYDESRIAVIPNAADVDFFEPPWAGPAQEAGEAGGNYASRDEDAPLTLVFIGAHGRANGLDAVLDAAQELRRRSVGGVRFLLVGDGSEKQRLQQRAASLELDSVEFRGLLPKTELPGLLRECDAGLMILADVPAFYDATSPNKFFDYLAAGLPVLNNYPGWIASIIEDERCGLAVPPGDPGAFAEAVAFMRDNPHERCAMGRRGRAVAEQRFARDVMADEFIAVLEAARRDR
jgi:glycosyltransferase involved in cell wall biosynthesis